MIRIGSRSSALAKAQATLVGNAIREKLGMEVSYQWMQTVGDKRHDILLSQIGGKGLFTRELEDALLEDRIDIAIHSAKDMPLELPDGLKLTSILKRASAKDVLLLRKDCQVQEIDGIEILKNLPAGFILGTSALRRSIQAKNYNSHILIKDIRGNIDTRIGKLKSGLYDGIILAQAGIERLDVMADVHTYPLREKGFVPACTQGILAMEYKRKEMHTMLFDLIDADTQHAFTCERDILEKKGGNCHSAFGAYCRKHIDDWEMILFNG